MTLSRPFLTLLLPLALWTQGSALAFSPMVNAAFKGQILVTKDPLTAKKNDK